MRFLITRTSTSHEDVQPPPIETAFVVEVDVIDTRTFATFVEYEIRCGHSFLAAGTNHKELPFKQGITRVVGKSYEWVVEVTTLEELLAIGTSSGYELLVTSESIEIVDGYLY